MATKKNSDAMTRGLVDVHNSAAARARRLAALDELPTISAPPTLQADAAVPSGLAGYAVYDAAVTLAPGMRVVLPIELLEENPWNPRVFYGAEPMQELVSSIARFGLQQPLQVYPCSETGGFRLKSGHRRTRACRQLKYKTVPVEVLAYSGDEVQDFQEAREINKQHRTQTHFDDAVRFRALLESKMVGSQSALAELMGLSEGEVSKILAIGRLPLGVLEGMAGASQYFGLSAAYAVFRFWVEQDENEEATQELVRKVVAGKLSFRELERLAKSKAPGAAPTRSHALTRAELKGYATGELKAFENRLTLRLDGIPADRRDALFSKLMTVLRDAGLADAVAVPVAEE